MPPERWEGGRDMPWGFFEPVQFGCVCAGLREYMRFEGLCYSIDTNFSTCVCARVRLHRVVRVFWSAYLSLSPERCDMSLGLFEQC